MTLYKGTVAGVRESALMGFPTRVTMNAPATSSCCCVSRQKRDVWCVRDLPGRIPSSGGGTGQGDGDTDGSAAGSSLAVK
jgi:hypothetical protein